MAETADHRYIVVVYLLLFTSFKTLKSGQVTLMQRDCKRSWFSCRDCNFNFSLQISLFLTQYYRWTDGQLLV